MESEEWDVFFMKRCLELASKAENIVAPNPMVGSVLVCENKIISEGYHQKFGEAHAEVNALKDVYDAELLKNSTLYVSLEPCSHYGKTPPCADLIIQKQIPRVVVACLDPNPMVSGNGIKKMTENGISVKIGVLEQEAKELNSRFFVYQQQKRPYVVLKWAETADGFISRDDFSSKWISGVEARTLAHQWRSHEMAILVGSNTAMHDNPTLDVRFWNGKNPIRCLVDRNLKVSEHFNVFKNGTKTLVFNSLKSGVDENLNIEWIKTPTDSGAKTLLQELFNRKISSVLIEGGARIHEMFLESSCVDEIKKVVSKTQKFNSGIPAVTVPTGFSMVQKMEIEHEIIFTFRKSTS
ncbi:MAG: bifunctional diaminohydroxyphosphoribosylaminopyrimidine deaminase/5-amino-6-(5-phosphoribosylamino)uracil reductase RibD [Cytophagales bacterium]